MKKNLVRILALALVLILALGLIPMGAFAATATIFKKGYNAEKPSVDTFQNDWEDFGDEIRTGVGDITVKASEYSNLYLFGGVLYELQGFVDGAKTDWSNPENAIQFTNSVTLKDGDKATLGYALHGHDLTCWIYDDNVHWKHCEECGEQFVIQNWHQDLNKDKTCDICGGPIRYYDITVVDVEGGKVTVSETSAPYRTRVNVTVEAESGYELHKVRFFKVRDNGSKQEIVRYQNGTDYYFEMPTYDVEVVAEFVKK